MATVRWRGNAAQITQVSTITVGGTWATNDTATITCNGNDIVCTVGTSTATTAVAALITAAINASTKSTDAAAGSYNIGGQQIPEFTEVTAATSGSTVVLTANTAGKPFTVTVAEGGGSSTISITDTVAATGKHFWSNVYNWSGGAVPVNDDDIWFDSGDVDCKYGLPNGSLEPASVNITLDYTGKIGLPEVNKDSGNPSTYYREYRQAFVTFDNDSASSTVQIKSGGGKGTGSPMVNIKWDSTTLCGVTVNGTGTPQAGVSNYALNIQGSGTFTAGISKGSVSFGEKAGQTTALFAVNIGYQTQVATDAVVYIGPGCTISSFVSMDAGSVVIDYAAWSTAYVTVNGGSLVLNYETTIDDLNAYGGTVDVFSGSGTITDVMVGAATVRNIRGGVMTFTNTTATKNAAILDPRKGITFTNGVDLYQCGIADVTLDMGEHFTISRTAI